VQGINLINGSGAPSVSMEVVKRGRSTGPNPHGTVTHVAISGTVDDKVRQFTNAFMIESKTNDPFSSSGDSGAAVLDTGNKIVGVLFGGAGLVGLATPWPDIVTAFPLGLNAAPPPPTGQQPNAVRTVPKSAAPSAAPHAKSLANVTAGDLHPTPNQRLGKHMEDTEREITATPAGREYAALVRRHFTETHQLITGNRRVGVAWQRNKGPQIVDTVMRMTHLRDRPLPAEIDGKPLIECLAAIQSALERYGSPELVADLATVVPRFEMFAGYSYDQVLAELKSEGAR
jgi:hypothetical protein